MMGQLPGEAKNYYIAHVRGPTYEKLRGAGFLVFYPAMDDYVFLEVSDKNKRLLNKQTEFMIYFLKKREKYLTVTRKELEAMTGKTTETIKEGAAIEVIAGYCGGLKGILKELLGNQCRCLLEGYNRQYNVLVDRLDIVLDDGKVEMAYEPG